MMEPADWYDDDPGITSWASFPDAVSEMRAALYAAEARAERAEKELSERSTQTRYGQEHDRRDRVRLLDAIRDEPEVAAVSRRITAREHVEAPLSEAILPLIARLRADAIERGEA